jgi:hypothetical protein
MYCTNSKGYVHSFMKIRDFVGNRKDSSVAGNGYLQCNLKLL